MPTGFRFPALLTKNDRVTISKSPRAQRAGYMRGNLLARKVAAEDVAQAFLAQALARRTTPTDDRRWRPTSRRDALT